MDVQQGSDVQEQPVGRDLLGGGVGFMGEGETNDNNNDNTTARHTHTGDWEMRVCVWCVSGCGGDGGWTGLAEFPTREPKSEVSGNTSATAAVQVDRIEPKRESVTIVE